jgi:hypothetical protein
MLDISSPSSPLVPVSPPRWCAVGSSTDPDATRAAAAAARDALRHDDPKLLVVFCSDGYDLPALGRGLAEAAPGVPLIGCTTAGEIATAGPADASVVVFALGGTGFSVATAFAPGASLDPRRAGERAASCLEHVEAREHRVLVMLSDGLSGGQQEVVRGAYGVAGASVPLVGGCAGDQLKMQRTFQLFDGEVLEDSVVAAAITSDAPLGIGVHHGWRKVGEPVVVTGSAGTRVLTLDHRPALDAYLARLGAPEAAYTDPAAFTEFALTHPLGVDRRSGTEVRLVVEANFDDRSLGFIADVPEGGMAWFMEGDGESVMEATDRACEAALDVLQGSQPIGMLAFDCVARRGVIGDQGIRDEVQRIAQHGNGTDVAGFYSYGEIARTRGINGFHNQTLVVLALS